MGEPGPTESLPPAAALIGRWRWPARLVSLWLSAAGLALVIFLGFHLLNLALALVDPAGFENTATALHALIWQIFSIVEDSCRSGSPLRSRRG